MKVKLDDLDFEVLVRPSCFGNWWWIPKCFLDEGKTDKGYWSIVVEGPDTKRVGLFVGPLVPPTLPNVPASNFGEHDETLCGACPCRPDGYRDCEKDEDEYEWFHDQNNAWH